MPEPVPRNGQELAGTERENDARWLAWVLMPDHFHGLVRLGDSADLSDLMRLFKGSSAFALKRALGRNSRLWKPGFHDHALQREESRIAVAGYIVANRLSAGLVTRLADHPHWDSVWLQAPCGSDFSPTRALRLPLAPLSG